MRRAYPEVSSVQHMIVTSSLSRHQGLLLYYTMITNTGLAPAPEKSSPAP